MVRLFIRLIFVIYFSQASILSHENILFPMSSFSDDLKIVREKKNICFRENEECFNIAIGKSTKEALIFLIMRKGESKLVFKFYAKNIYDFYMSEHKLIVIFRPETEEYGWIEESNHEYVFKMFYDDEM